MRPVGLLAFALACTPPSTPSEVVATVEGAPFELSVLGRHTGTGGYAAEAAEMLAYEPSSQRLFVSNPGQALIDVVDLSDPAQPELITSIDVSGWGERPNGLAVQDTRLAVVVEAIDRQDPGAVLFFDLDGQPLSGVTVGAQPETVLFSPDGARLYVANEGEPSDGYQQDPEGSISVVDLSMGVDDPPVQTIDFQAVDPSDGVRIYGPGASVAQDLEPESMTLSADGATAWVAFQENNAIARVDLVAGAVVNLRGLGVKDHDVEGQGLDASDSDGRIDIGPQPISSMYMPDGLASFEADGATWLVTANEGDGRNYRTFSEVVRLADVTLDPTAYPDANKMQELDEMGRLKISQLEGDTDGDGDIDRIHVMGARSVSVWSETGELVWDSGDFIERTLATILPDEFNCDAFSNGTFDDRSDDGGPEPEGVVVGEVEGVPYAFVALERIGGIMVWSLEDPRAPVFTNYLNSRDFSGDAASGTAGDLSPEGMVFIDADTSPNGQPLLVVAHEVSGTTTIYAID